MSDQSDFNLFIASDYWHKAENIAHRFWERGCADWAKLACVWHVKYRFGKDAPVGDVFWEGNIQRRRSVDQLIAHPETNDQAEIMFNCWLGYKKNLDARRIEPPKPTPPPLPKPIPLPEPKPKSEPKPEPAPKKNPSPGLVKFGMYLSAACTAASIVAWFIPGAKPYVAAVVTLIKTLLGAFGL